MTPPGEGTRIVVRKVDGISTATVEGPDADVALTALAYAAAMVAAAAIIEGSGEPNEVAVLAPDSRGRAPYWLDYLSRERTMCSICKSIDGKGWVRIGPPIPAGMSTRRGAISAHRNRQRAAFQRHVAENHPTLRVRWTR